MTAIILLLQNKGNTTCKIYFGRRRREDEVKGDINVTETIRLLLFYQKRACCWRYNGRCSVNFGCVIVLQSLLQPHEIQKGFSNYRRTHGRAIKTLILQPRGF